MRMFAIGLAALLVATGLSACTDHQERTPTTSPTVGGPPMRRIGPGVMLRHEVLSISVREAVVRGDLSLARRNAFDLGSVTMDGSPEVVERAQEMHDAAVVITNAPDLEAAARGVGRLARTCADCHARMIGPTRLDPQDPPPPDAGRRVRMQRHVWAMNALWDGIVANSEPPWNAGAAILADRELVASELVPRRIRTPEIEALAESMQSLGGRAALASDIGVRSEIYGELLTTCASCHARARTRRDLPGAAK